MPGRWNDERERDWQDWRAESDWRDRERGEDRGYRWGGGEERSFGRGGRVFGERDTGVEYNRPRESDWQPRHYGGHRYGAPGREYERGYRGPRFQAQDYTHGGRYYGDDAREPIYREEYGLGGHDYGYSPRGYDAGRRYGSREAEERYARQMRRVPSGGTGGYDYELGYGDGGRPEGREHGDFEDRAREAGDFFRRTGRRISSWFSDIRSDMDYRDDERRYEDYRGARGLGPKGYKRSDERISDEVHQRLTDDAWLDASEINVSVSNGEVTLSGSIETRESKHRAERIVEDISGVSHVQNNLRVKPGSYFTSAGRGYGDNVQEARMASSSEPAKSAGDGDAAAPGGRRT